MKYIMCQPSNNRFKWELEVAISDLMRHGISDIVILFLKEYDSISDYFKNNFDVEVHVYDDDRFDKSYIPSIKPYLMYRYLLEDGKRENETYFYMDSDMVFKQLPDFEEIPVDKHTWYGSNCNSYMNYDYLKQCTHSEAFIGGMAGIVGIDEQSIKDISNHSIGAQYLIRFPSKDYFHKVYMDSIKLWRYIQPINTNFQKWTVEMYATLWNMIYFDIEPQTHPELDFVFATDSIEKYKQVNILHNAGVTHGDKDLFRKFDYISKDPFNEKHDYVNTNKASFAYVEKLNAAKNILNKG